MRLATLRPHIASFRQAANACSQEFAKEAYGHLGIAPFLHEDIECLAVLIHGRQRQ
jgi:hypothetical protein